MPGQIVAPTPISPGRSLNWASSQDLYASMSATLASKGTRIVSHTSSIPTDDYVVPPPPPSSPVSFRASEKKWQASPLRR